MSERNLCRRGLHSMTDPANVIRRTRDNWRECRACRNARARAKRDPARPPSVLTSEQTQALQMTADGMCNTEAGEVLYVTPGAVRARLRSVQQRLGTQTTAAAVGAALALGLITPARGGPLPCEGPATAPWVASVRDLIQGRRPLLGPRTWERRRLLDVLYAWSEPHAVSVLWAAGLITAADVPDRAAQQHTAAP